VRAFCHWTSVCWRGSRSATTTSRPACAHTAASARASVLLPVPPFWLTKAITAGMAASPYGSPHHAAAFSPS
jgi:hypothetical protein